VFLKSIFALKMKKKIFLLIIPAITFAQINFIGNYTKHFSTDTTVRFYAGANVIEFKFLRDDIVQVLFFPDSSEIVYDESFVVIQNCVGARWGLQEADDKFFIQTDSIVIRIDKSPLRIYFYDRKGKLLLKERNTGGFGFRNREKYVFFEIQPDEHFYGLGQKGIEIDRKGYAFSTYNQHIVGYDSPLKTMQVNIPFVQSNYNYALYFDITFPGYFDFGVSVQSIWYYMSEDGVMNYYFIYASSIKETLKKYLWLTGFPPIPPKWSFGFLQSRFGYRNQTEAENIVNTFSQKNIPLDAIILDLYWFGWGNMGNMTWDRNSWNDPIGMISNFKSKGVKTIVISEPYINVSSFNFSFADENKFFAFDSTGRTYIFQNFWATPSSLLDLTNPQAQVWWWGKYKNLLNEGVAGFWTDLGEPENHPDFLNHHLGSARKVHNIYNFLWAKTLYDGYRNDFPNKRIFNLTRSGFAGIQRFGVVTWSGDVRKSFNGLKVQIPMLIGMVMSGIPYHNSDIGGFTGGTTTSELYIRWIQFGTFCPVMRPHGHNQPLEPWAFGEDVEKIVRKYIELRYRLIPYIYTYAYKTWKYGETLIKPVLYEFPNDPQVYNISYEYLFGDFLLVAPVFINGQREREVYLPLGCSWINYWTGEIYSGGKTVQVNAPLDQIPLFIRIPSIIPMAKFKKFVNETPDDTLYIEIYPGDVEFELYEDDGETNGYERGEFSITKLKCQKTNNFINFTIDKTRGIFAGQVDKRCWFLKFNLIDKFDSVSVNGLTLEVLSDSLKFLSSPNSAWFKKDEKILYVKLCFDISIQIDVKIFGVDVVVGMKDDSEVNLNFQVYQNYPNPFNPETIIEFELPQDLSVEILIYDLLGRLVKSFELGELPSGKHRFKFYSHDLPSGVYFYVISAGNFFDRKKMVVLK
jgi:alpha-glucosidase (family GH31 glycosyl hydrolase)